MTQQQRRATRSALARYGQRGYRQTFEGRGWSLAIEQALRYYDQTDPIRARLLRMRYFEHRSIEDVMEQLNLSYSTYQKAHSDLLSTIAVYAAHNQVFWLDFGCSQPSWWWQEAQLPPQPSPFQPPCLEIQTTASPNRMARTRTVIIPRIVIKKTSLWREVALEDSIHYFAVLSNCSHSTPKQTSPSTAAMPMTLGMAIFFLRRSQKQSRPMPRPAQLMPSAK